MNTTIPDHLKHKTSKRINFATDEWGMRDETHLEIAWRGSTLMIDITEDKIHIIGPLMVVDVQAVNALEITPRKL